jgi:hypothetical protein
VNIAAVRPSRFVSALAAGALLLSTSPAFAAGLPPKKPAVVKPADPAAAKGPIVLGTTQLPGDFGKLGQTYTIGKRDPINFTLDSARYVADRFFVNGRGTYPKADEKLLVLRFTVHNPQPRDVYFDGARLTLTAVDAQDTNHVASGEAVRAGVTDQPAFGAALKPAQKVQLETVIRVPAKGEAPKLIVQREDGAPVIRYDLRGKAAPVAAPFADPADTTGATALKDVPVAPGAYVPFGGYDLKVESVAAVTGKLNGYAPQAGSRYLTVICSLRNATGADQPYYPQYFDTTLRDADGEKVAGNHSMLKASRDELASGKLAPGEEARVRFFFPLPTGVKAKSFTISEGLFGGRDGRTLTFDLTGLTEEAAP